MTAAFALHYSRVSMLLERVSDPDALLKRVSKISVQWFSNKELTIKMTKDISLLQVMIISMKNMISKVVVPFAGR